MRLWNDNWSKSQLLVALSARLSSSTLCLQLTLLSLPLLPQEHNQYHHLKFGFIIQDWIEPTGRLSARARTQFLTCLSWWSPLGSRLTAASMSTSSPTTTCIRTTLHTLILAFIQNRIDNGNHRLKQVPQWHHWASSSLSLHRPQHQVSLCFDPLSWSHANDQPDHQDHDHNVSCYRPFLIIFKQIRFQVLWLEFIRFVTGITMFTAIFLINAIFFCYYIFPTWRSSRSLSSSTSSSCKTYSFITLSNHVILATIQCQLAPKFQFPISNTSKSSTQPPSISIILVTTLQC